MDRLFVFGDSWAFNYFSKESKDRPDVKPFLTSTDVLGFVKEFNFRGHWTDYMEEYYNIYNFSEPAVSIEEIIYQFGFLPDYEDGDRIVVIFPIPNRFTWVHKGKKKSTLIFADWFKDVDNKELSYLEEQLVERLEIWKNTNQRDKEKRFIEKLPVFFEKYKPILLTWDDDMNRDLKNVKHVPITPELTSIEQESGGKYKDKHLGINGNFHLFKKISDELGLKINKTSTPPIKKTFL